MAVKQIEIEGIGPVSLLKRRGARTVRVSVGHKGEVKVSMPSWAPYTIGIEFAKAKREWILAQKPAISHIGHKQRVGKAHHIVFERTTGHAISARLVGNEIRVLMPEGYSWQDAAVQEAADRAAVRALKKEAKSLLPHRLETLAKQHGFTYRSVGIKRLSGRWGSCSEKQDIIFNCYLMQLPWHLIDYVIMHELVHTRIMAHGPVFWAEVGKYVPSLKVIRAEMKHHKPVLQQP